MPDSEPPNVDDEFRTTIRLTEQDVRDATRLFKLLSSSSEAAPSSAKLRVEENSARQDLIARARAILSNRQLRSRYFSPAIFGEPAWDVLLVLYIGDASDARLTIGKLASQISIPPTTVLRWVNYLEKERLVSRQRHPTDRRVVFIRLQEKGRWSLESYLRATPNQIKTQ
jgi:DNA-binding MarR family transcriptional regulator